MRLHKTILFVASALILGLGSFAIAAGEQAGTSDVKDQPGMQTFDANNAATLTAGEAVDVAESAEGTEGPEAKEGPEGPETNDDGPGQQNERNEKNKG